MKTPLRHLLLAALLALVCIPGYSWGQKGHDVTCAVAEQHLSRKARKAVAELLGGQSLVYWANWMDNASHTPEFEYSSTWHYKNIDAGVAFDDAPLNPKGDVVSAIHAQIDILKNPDSPQIDRMVALRMLVHMVGDIHCPMHMGHKTDLGGNTWQVRYFNAGRNLHSVWDSAVVESGHNWGYSEWVEQIDRYSRKENRAIAAGTVEDWGRETLAICASIYDATPVGSKLSFDYVATWTPVVEAQLLKGGLRLARVLNEIYR